MISGIRILFMAFLLGLPRLLVAQDYCMRFFGHGTGDIDRVKIPIDAPPRPVDVSFDFTLEFQFKAVLSENPLVQHPIALSGPQ